MKLVFVMTRKAGLTKKKTANVSTDALGVGDCS